MNADITRRGPRLLVDIEHGTVLDAPPTDTVTRRWAESHPFIEIVDGGTLLAGPDAARAAGGAGGRDLVEYEITHEAAGSLDLTRVA